MHSPEIVVGTLSLGDYFLMGWEPGIVHRVGEAMVFIWKGSAKELESHLNC